MNNISHFSRAALEDKLKVYFTKIRPLCLLVCQSVYPAMLSRGLPQRHHIVIYMLLHSPLSHLQLQVLCDSYVT